MTNPIAALNRLFLSPVDARSYALVRIAFAAVALLNLIDIWPERMSLLSDEGLFRRPSSLVQYHTISAFYVFHSPAAVNVLMLAAAGAIVLQGIGLFTRIASVAVWFWHVSSSNGMYPAVSASDALFRTLSFLLMLSPAGDAWSLDAWMKRKRQRGDLCPLSLSYGLVLMQLQLSVLYLTTFLAKIPDPGWVSGDEVGFFLLSVYARHPLLAIADYPRLVVLLSYSALAIELTLPWLLWHRRTRPLGFLLGWGMHGTILAVSRLGMFSLVTMVAYLSFLDSDDIETAKSCLLKVRRVFAMQKRSGDPSLPKELQPHVTAHVPARSTQS